MIPGCFNSSETVVWDGIDTLLAYTGLRLEGWTTVVHVGVAGM